MINLNRAGAPLHGSAPIILQAEAYLASLPELSGGDLKAMLADGMVLVSGLLCGETNHTPTQERHSKLAKLVLAKMQRITRENARHAKQDAYPCFSS
ncbi:hypothetical protein [Noviherbaspirillum sedimenti]|uniref:Uncharacterized protein n=1 Tax=Noviherbaspirillum sedimenti TaxID=2320865 RepID=A0A3A3G275_9BURK|nr:hypothetical protein [Noviherbaspirillum sedimenti]RJG02573.1 hypothetical protein D3878_14140 [Noviherbaspirillum sedimenti]